MRALRFKHRKVSVDDVRKPDRSDEAIVRVLMSGICNTDLEIVSGYAGFEGTIGHEFVGIVEQAADAPDLVGRRIVGEINAGCGFCASCSSGDPRHCPARTVLGIVGRDGAHADYLQLPTRNLLEIPAGVTDEQAVFAEPLAAALAVSEQVKIDETTKVTVIGDGKLGLLCAMALSLSSRNVTIVGKHAAKIAIAEKAGVNGVLLEDIDDSMHRLADVVVEASGSESGFFTAIGLVRPRGKIVLKSTFHGTPMWPASRLVVDEITVIGSRCGRMEPALRLLEKGLIPVEDLITEQHSLSDGVQALNRAGQKGVLKVLLKTT